MFVCVLVFVIVSVIQHRNWPLRSIILNAHGTNASPDGLCTRTHTNEAFLPSFALPMYKTTCHAKHYLYRILECAIPVPQHCCMCVTRFMD